MAHLVRADFGISHLVAHGRLDGWFPRFVVGHQEFLFNGPGLTWLIAAVRAFTFGAASNVAALKVICVASLVALPPAVSFLARSLGLGRRASGLAAVLSILVSTPFGVGLRGVFETGLVPHQVGAVFFCLALGAAVRSAGDHRRRWVVLLAGSLAALAVTHVISLLVLGVVMALTVAVLAMTHRVGPGRVGPGALLRLAIGTAGGAGLAGFWLVPFVAHRDLQGIVTTWAPPPLLRRLGAIATGDILFPAGLGFVVLAAWGYQAHRARHDRSPAALVWILPPVAYLLVAHGLPHVVGLNEATLQLANRGLGYAGLLAIVAVAALLADGVRRWGRLGYAATLIVTAAAAIVWAPGRDSAGQFSEPVPALRAAAAELARLVPDGARFATERDYPAEVRRTGVIHPETWLARASGRNSLNGFNLESSSTPRAALLMNRLDGVSATRIAHRLGRLGVTHVVATTEDFVARLVRSPRFVVVWRGPPVAILALQPVAGRPAPASQVAADRPMTAELVQPRPERLAFRIDAGEPAMATLALAWSPKWHGALNGKPVRLGRTNDGLIQLPLPAGRHDLRLDYRGDGWDSLGMLTTLATVLGGAVALLRARHRALTRRPRSKSPPAGVALTSLNREVPQAFGDRAGVQRTTDNRRSGAAGTLC
ncbi:MAG TPA: hypothetical protein VEG38_19995 [Acidimicrobiia bacterium]|nr:hypothetical protein [Acidimicrobiia bacterium]